LVSAVPPLSTNPDAATSYNIALPAALLFITPKANGSQEPLAFERPTGPIRFVSCSTGLERGGSRDIPPTRSWTAPTESSGRTYISLNGGDDCEVVLDYFGRVPSKASCVEVDLRNTQTQFGNGTRARFRINGLEVLAEDMGASPNPSWTTGMPEESKYLWDTTIHRWRIPVGKWAGQLISVSTATDPKCNDNADELWWSLPRFVIDSSQQVSVKTLGQPR
jgi:hypothetical protein